MKERVRYSRAASHLTEIDMTSWHARHTQINQAEVGERVWKTEPAAAAAATMCVPSEYRHPRPPQIVDEAA